jgi:hypothetical protein
MNNRTDLDKRPECDCRSIGLAIIFAGAALLAGVGQIHHLGADLGHH